MIRYEVVRGDGSTRFVEAARVEAEPNRNGVNFYDEESNLVAQFTGLQGFCPVVEE